MLQKWPDLLRVVESFTPVVIPNEARGAAVCSEAYLCKEFHAGHAGHEEERHAEDGSLRKISVRSRAPKQGSSEGGVPDIWVAGGDSCTDESISGTAVAEGGRDVKSHRMPSFPGQKRHASEGPIEAHKQTHDLQSHSPQTGS